jgi:hypothetical protein
MGKASFAVERAEEKMGGALKSMAAGKGGTGRHDSRGMEGRQGIGRVGP